MTTDQALPPFSCADPCNFRRGRLTDPTAGRLQPSKAQMHVGEMPEVPDQWAWSDKPISSLISSDQTATPSPSGRLQWTHYWAAIGMLLVRLYLGPFFVGFFRPMDAT